MLFVSLKKKPTLNNCRLDVLIEIGVEIRKSRIMVVMVLSKKTTIDGI